MSVVSKSFTAADTTSATLKAVKGESVAIALSGTYAATLVLERALTPDESAWAPVGQTTGGFVYNTANATVADTFTVNTHQDERLRLRCTKFTSGTVVTTLTNGTSVVDGPDITLNRNFTVNGAFHRNQTSGNPILAGSTLTLTNAAHAGKVINLDQLAGSVVTLPPAIGSMDAFLFRVHVVATSNSHIVKTSPSTDAFSGGVTFADTDGTAAVDSFMAVASGSVSNTITLNRSTTGSVTIGEWFECQDVGAGMWQVKGLLSNTGTPTTPFSHV